MRKSDIIFWSTMFFAFSFLIGHALGIKQMVICWFIFLLMYLFFEITIQYKKMLENIFD